MVFYKESDKTNKQNIKKNPRDLDRYSQNHDLIFDFRWTKGKFVARFKYKNGTIIGSEDIIIKDIPDSVNNILK